MGEARVWVVHPTKDDISSAAVFGTITFITDRYVYGDEIRNDGGLPPYVHHRLKQAALDFDHTTDKVLIVGDHLQVVTLCAMLGSLGHDFTVLRYDRKVPGYYPVIIRQPKFEDCL